MSTQDVSGGQLPPDELTWREQGVLALLAERLTNREIAQRLHLAESTVKDYVGRILSKLYVANRRQAVERARALGLLDSGRRAEVELKAHLPAQKTQFLGRRAELGEIERLVGETRLLTLTGPGGIGKTRLALQAAEDAAGRFRDGAYFVSLAPVPAADDLVQAIAEGIGFPLATHEDPLHQLLRQLKRKHLLVVLDNFEHLMDGARIVDQILQAAPQVMILVTSRERLKLQRESIMVVGGMGFPGTLEPEDLDQHDAIALFLQSARKVRPGYLPPAEELDQIARICQVVQGMPLAIELAAAWLTMLNVDEILEELEEGLDILSTDQVDAPERHRSIRAVFDHSWSMVPPAEQETFRQLSVFRGGFTREAARQITGAELQSLAGLVSRSLLSHDPDSGRLQSHELLRQYAYDQLGSLPGAAAAAREAHAAFFAGFMRQRWQEIQKGQAAAALVKIEADLENVRAAWRHTVDGRNVARMWHFANGLWHGYWFWGWMHAGRELFSVAVEAVQEMEDREAIALTALLRSYEAYFLAWLGLPEQGYAIATRSVEVLEELDQREALGPALQCTMVNAYLLDRFAEYPPVCARLIELAIETGDRRLHNIALYGMSLAAVINKEYAEGERHGRAGLALCEESGDLIGMAYSLIALGHWALAIGDRAGAARFFQRCLTVSLETEFRWAIANATKHLGKIALSLGDAQEAENHLTHSLRITSEIRYLRDLLILLYDFGRLRKAQGSKVQAAELLACVAAHPASHQARWPEGQIRDMAEGVLAELKAELPAEVHAAAVERGRGLDLDGVVADLLEPTGSG